MTLTLNNCDFLTKKTKWFEVRESQRVEDPVCECAVAGGHSAGKLRGPAAGAVQPLHRLQPAGPLCAHSTLGPKSFRLVMGPVLSLLCDSCSHHLLCLVPSEHLCSSPGVAVGFVFERHLELGTHSVFFSDRAFFVTVKL